jgi:hypothetical protein
VEERGGGIEGEMGRREGEEEGGKGKKREGRGRREGGHEGGKEQREEKRRGKEKKGANPPCFNTITTLLHRYRHVTVLLAI